LRGIIRVLWLSSVCVIHFATCLAAMLIAGAAWAEERPLPPSRPAAAAAEPVAAPSGTGRNAYLPLIAREAKARGLPAEVADAVARVESGYNPGVVGGSGERGLMQVMPPTAAMLGFRGGPAALADPETNIKLGVQYLAGAWRLAKGDLCRALMKYRAGHNEERMSPLSVEYCRRARDHLAAQGSALALAQLPQADYFPAGGAVHGGPTVFGDVVGRARVVRVAGRLRRIAPIRTAATSRNFWAAHAARIRQIEARLPWKRGGIIAGG
jgi:hypothetical protein